MFETMRKVFGPAAVTVIIGAIALVFVFYGIYNPRSTKGQGEGALAVTVNGDAISMQEFYREYQQRVDFYQGMMKGKADMSMLKQLGLKNQVLEDMIRRKLMTQEADRMGLRVSDEEVREKIQEMPYFKKDGKFDALHYTKVLEANRYSPAAFEESVRQDLVRDRLTDFVRARARVSEKEVENEYLSSEDKRQVDYVVLTRDFAKGKLSVTDKEIDDFLKTEPGLNAAKQYYEQNKFTYMKAMPKPKPPVKGAKAEAPKEMPKPEYRSFDEVKKQVALEVLRERRTDEIAKINSALAKELLEQAKGGSAKLKAFAKAKGAELKTSEKFNRTQGYVPGIGESSELLDDAFKADSPLGKGAKQYEVRGNTVIALGLKTFSPDPAGLSKEREKLSKELASRKEQMFFEQWVGDLRARAKLDINKEAQREEE